MAPNYSKAKIYGIRSAQTTKWYIGATTLRLCERMAQFRKHYKAYQAGREAHDCVYDLLQYDDTLIYLIEDYPCNSKDELNARLAEYTQDYATNLINSKKKKKAPKTPVNSSDSDSDSSYETATSYTSESSYEPSSSDSEPEDVKPKPVVTAPPVFVRPPNSLPKPKPILLNIVNNIV